MKYSEHCVKDELIALYEAIGEHTQSDNYIEPLPVHPDNIMSDEKRRALSEAIAQGDLGVTL